MASSSSAREYRPFSRIEPPDERTNVSESSRLYDVFVNHRGPDVKNTLALKLYESLKKWNIRAFHDSEEKELGDSFISTIKIAVKSAAVHIAIFSKGYPESRWCLEELVLMLQSGAKIIPLFYGVQPSDLRYIEKGKYKEAFIKHEEKKRYNMDEIKEWKKALHTVSFLAGEVFNNSSDWDCEKIVSAVQKEVERKKLLIVAKHPVGLTKLVQDFEKKSMDKLVQDFEGQCEMNKEREGGKARIAGIFGIGGVGKTTLSKELFNRKCSSCHPRSCFLLDVREASLKGQLPSLQMKLLKDLFNENDHPDFSDIEDGKRCLSSRFAKRGDLRFLIVLDDVDDHTQLDALLFSDDINRSGDNLVIVTTRDEGVLITADISFRYEMKGMDRDDAEELFCWHAFSQAHPCRGYEELVYLFVNACCGLPLSLQVLGSHVHGRDKTFWWLELEKLHKTLPQEIQKRLKISIDMLETEEKQIFMDIACFFIGEIKRDAINVWNAFGWSAEHALTRLKDKCLVQEESDERSLFKEENFEHFPWDERSLFKEENFEDISWDERSLFKEENFEDFSWDERCLFEEENSEKRFVSRKHGEKRFVLRMHSDERCVLRMHDHLRDLGREMANELNHPRRLWRPQHLQSLTSKGLKDFFSQAKHRCLVSFSHPSQHFYIKFFHGESDNMAETSTALVWLELRFGKKIPAEIPLQNLFFLRIRDGEMQKLWPGRLQVPFLIKDLQMLKIRGLEELNLGPLRCLLKVSIVYCDCLKRVTGIVDHMRLVEFNITKCSKLKVFGSNEVSSVKKSRISGLEIVRGIVDHMPLLEFNITKCRGLEKFGSNEVSCVKKSRISGLVKLKIEECAQLHEINFAHLNRLEKITIFCCRELRTLKGQSYLRKLVEMKITECPELEELCLLNLSCVERIEIYGCSKLKSLGGTSDLRKLVALQIALCPELEELCLLNLSCVERIKIYRCSKLKSLGATSDLRKLVELQIALCLELEEFCLLNLSCVERIKIDRCSKLKSLGGTSDLRKLVELQIAWCPELEELSLLNLSCVERIKIDVCSKLKSLGGTSDLRKLVELQIAWCPELEELRLAELGCLDKIMISGCSKLRIVTLFHFMKLRELSFHGCKQIEELSLVRVSSLEKFLNFYPFNPKINQVKGCGSKDLYSLVCLKSAKLDFEDCPKLNIKLTLRCCRKLPTVTGMDDSADCPEVQFDELNFPPRLIRWLEIIEIDSCEKMQKIAGIERLQSLERLQLLYFSKATIQNCILKMKKLPSEFVQLIGRPKDGAELSTLNANLFCNGDIRFNSVIEFGSDDKCSEGYATAIILCAVFVIDTSTAAQQINSLMRELDCNPWQKFEMRQGKWIMTCVTTNEEEVHRYICNNGYVFPLEYIFEDGIVKKGYKMTMTMKKPEEHRILDVLRKIVDELYF